MYIYLFIYLYVLKRNLHTPQFFFN